MSKLDKKDHQILFELDCNSRTPIQQIAKKTKLSRDVVSYRIKQLEEKGIIQKYITIVDFTKFGYQMVRLYLKLQNTTPTIEEEICQFFAKKKETMTVYKTDGEYDIGIGFFIKGLASYQKQYEEFLKKYGKYVQSKRFSIFLDYIHYNRNYLINKKRDNDQGASIGSYKLITYDEKDIELLHHITENARCSLLELATKLNMTAAGVKYKLNNLQKNNVIVAYKLLIDTSKIEYQYFKVDLELEDMNIIPSLTQYITQNQHVIYRNIMVGGSDFEFDVELKHINDLQNLIDNIKELFPQKIRRSFYYKALKIYKYSYFPSE